MHGVLAEASRTARASVDVDRLPLLQASAQRAQRIGAKVGVAAQYNFVPHMDVRNMTIGAGILALHDGNIPARQAGLGTSRLLTLALQHEAARAGGITLIDEIEHGLEPHRLRRLLNVLLAGRRLDDQEQQVALRGPSANQTWATTHAAIAISELQPEHIGIVRSKNGKTTVQTPDASLRPLIRKHPEALLAHKIIVCEGKTEIGICRALGDYWAAGEEKSLAYAGAALVDGNGGEAARTTQSFAKLGYETAIFGDSDVPKILTKRLCKVRARRCCCGKVSVALRSGSPPICHGTASKKWRDWRRELGAAKQSEQGSRHFCRSPLSCRTRPSNGQALRKKATSE